MFLNNLEIEISHNARRGHRMFIRATIHARELKFL